ncbi:hypothetical protein BDZ97DRAFT_812489 [Flammula alnicola]|nr:hypothetical protein BDZ97DRAFT_812489 [Flammula alnicola]
MYLTYNCTTWALVVWIPCVPVAVKRMLAFERTRKIRAPPMPILLRIVWCQRLEVRYAHQGLGWATGVRYGSRIGNEALARFRGICSSLHVA